MKKFLIAIAFMLLLVPGHVMADEPLKVFVSILPQEFFLKAIGKDKVKVTVMVPPGANPAVYEPKPTQMVKLAETDLYFAIGVPFETAWLPKIADSNPKMIIVHTDANVPKIPISGHHHEDADGNLEWHGDDHNDLENDDDHPDEHADNGETLDPHIWLDPALVKIQARNITDALNTADPFNSEFYEKNYHAFIQRCDEVDAQVRAKLKGCEGITFMTFHPAWGYYAKAYGMHQLTVEVGGREPSPAQLKELIDQAKAAGVKVIFVQPQFDQKHARTIAKATGTKLLIADPLELDWVMCLLNQANRIQRMY